jgi:predicted membrane-bound mannosyltransferase
MKRKQQKYSNKKVEYIILICILFCAFIIRVIYIKEMSLNYEEFIPNPATDMGHYHNCAQKLLNGQIPEKPYFYCPLYYHLLAVIYLIFGINPLYGYLFNNLLGILTAFFVYLISKELFKKLSISLLSAGLTAFCFDILLHEAVLLSAVLDTFLATAVILFLILWVRKQKLRYLLLSGFFIGFLSLSRPNTLLFLIAVWVWFVFVLKNFKLILKNICIITAVTILTILPCTLVNYLTSTKFVLISANGPYNLWIGNNKNAPGWFDKAMPEELIKKVKEEGDKAYINDVLEFIKEVCV